MVDRGTGAVNDLHKSPAGRIYVHAVTQLEISSTELRQIIDAGRDPRFLVPMPCARSFASPGVMLDPAEDYFP